MAEAWNEEILLQFLGETSTEKIGLPPLAGKFSALLMPFWITVIMHPALAALYRFVLRSRYYDMSTLCMNIKYPKYFRHAIACILGELLLKNPYEFVPDIMRDFRFPGTSFSFPTNYNNAALVLPIDKFPTGERMSVVLATLQEFRRAFTRPGHDACKLRIFGERDPEEILITRGYCRPSHLYVLTTKNTMMDFCEITMSEKELHIHFKYLYCQGAPRSTLHRLPQGAETPIGRGTPTTPIFEEEEAMGSGSSGIMVDDVNINNN